MQTAVTTEHQHARPLWLGLLAAWVVIPVPVFMAIFMVGLMHGNAFGIVPFLMKSMVWWLALSAPAIWALLCPFAYVLHSHGKLKSAYFCLASMVVGSVSVGALGLDTGCIRWPNETWWDYVEPFWLAAGAFMGLLCAIAFSEVSGLKK